MTKPMIRIHDLETDEVIDREMTDAEYEVHLEELAVIQARLDEEAAKKAEKEALLDRLGISADEAKLLLS